MTNHTLGPWVNDRGLVTGRDSTNSAQPSFDIYDATNWQGNEVEGQANACLIAAAPDLLKALTELTPEAHTRMLGSAGHLIDNANAAIVKAVGKKL